MPNVVPYNFVPLGNGKRKVTPVDPYDRNLLHGSISCTLKTVTPLFIPNTTGDSYFVNEKGEKEKHRIRTFFSQNILTKKPTKGDKGPAFPIIPGSSIRGVLRSVYEAASNSCLRTVDDDDLGLVLPKYQPCLSGETSNGCLCPACSLFGMIGKGEGKSYGSRIRIRDTEKEKNKNITYQWIEIPGQFGPHEIMYTKVTKTVRTQDGKKKEIREIKGRKFYWHHQPDIEAKYSKRGDTILCIMPDAEFKFEVQFDGITEDELKQLVAVIRLDGCGRHKLGAAKPLGYGSVQMDIEEVTIRELKPVENGILYQNCVVTDTYKDVTMQDAFGNQDNHLDDLMNILRFHAVSSSEGEYSLDVQYPSAQNGLNPGNGQVFEKGTISEIIKKVENTREKNRLQKIQQEKALKKAMKDKLSEEQIAHEKETRGGIFAMARGRRR